ncbi:BrxA family protein [Blautia sp. HCP3S3_C4]|uniref:BrxA family protein n=1 Tax=Blautia sp. HCP3S3_C4 TaxID=3438911 RepID=UPI003F8B5D99
MANLQLNSPYKGSASLTREQFLFYEMRTTAKLIEEGVNNTEIMKKVFNEN